MSFERRKVRIGRVVSDKMDRTVVVLVEWRRRHRLYRKPIRRGSRFKAHDENNAGKVGDLVRIMETRPLSKTKRWRLVEIVAREEIAEVQPEDIDRDGVLADGVETEAEVIAEEVAPTKAEKPAPKTRARRKAAEPAAEADTVAEAEEVEPAPKPRARKKADEPVVDEETGGEVEEASGSDDEEKDEGKEDGQ